MLSSPRVMINFMTLGGGNDYVESSGSGHDTIMGGDGNDTMNRVRCAQLPARWDRQRLHSGRHR